MPRPAQIWPRQAAKPPVPLAGLVPFHFKVFARTKAEGPSTGTDRPGRGSPPTGGDGAGLTLGLILGFAGRRGPLMCGGPPSGFCRGAANRGGFRHSASRTTPPTAPDERRGPPRVFRGGPRRGLVSPPDNARRGFPSERPGDDLPTIRQPSARFLSESRSVQRDSPAGRFHRQQPTSPPGPPRVSRGGPGGRPCLSAGRPKAGVSIQAPR